MHPRLLGGRDRREQEDGDHVPGDEALTAEAPVLSVSGLTAIVRRAIEGEERLRGVRVEGEVSNWKPYPSGHVYFTLKDDESVVDCVFFHGVRRLAGVDLGVGAHAVAVGDVRVYPQRGRYQLYVSALRPAGAGALWAAFEALKRRLEAEGLTARERKRPLPLLPRRVGIVTSAEGAAIRDILNVLGRRFPLVEVVVRSVPVQGREAAGAIVAGIADVARRGGVDVMIVGRGGGSIEDLWAFNEEAVARAIDAASRTHGVPVVSAVGHETDITIADLVADVRAATPTEAAELVVPARDDVLAGLDALARRAGEAAERRLAVADANLEALRASLRSPRDRLDLRRERLDRLAGDIAAAAGEAVASRRATLEDLRRRLAAVSPAARLARTRHALETAARRAGWLVERRRDRAVAALEATRGRLEATNPLAVLARGYSVVFDAAGRAVRDAAAVRPGDEVRARLHRGEFDARVVRSR